MPAGVRAGTVYLDVRPNLEGFEDKLKRATEPATKRVSDRINKAGAGMAKVGQRMSLAVTAPLVGLGAVALNAASDLEESQSKVRVVFGESAAGIEKWASTAATSMGQSKQQALEAAGTFGNLFSAMGLAQKPAADMSKQVVGLAGDLASFNNASPEDTLLALRAGLVGETEPLRKFGVNINQARIQAEALSTGLVKPQRDMAKLSLAQVAVDEANRDVTTSIKKHGRASAETTKANARLIAAEQRLKKALEGEKVELTSAQKAQAAYSIIMKDTKLAQGDFARTSEGVANKQRILRAQFQDAAATIGTQLLPIGKQLLGFATGLLQKFQALSPGTQKVILIVGAAVAALGPLLAIVGRLTQAIGLVGKALSFLAANPVVAVIAGIILVGLIIYKFRRQIVSVLTRVRDFFVAVFNKIKDAIKIAVLWIVDKWLWLAEKIVGGAATAFGWVPGLGDKLKGARDKITEFRKGVNAELEKIKGPDVAIKIQPVTIPASGARFHARGGIFNRPTLGVFGEEGPEAIVPLSARRAADRERVLRQAGLVPFAAGGIVGDLSRVRAGVRGVQSGALRLIEGKLSIDERGQAWIRGVVAGELEDDRAFAGTAGRMQR